MSQGQSANALSNINKSTAISMQPYSKITNRHRNTNKAMHMTLYLIGLGLAGEKDITLRGLEAMEKCSFIYFERYTSLFSERTVEDCLASLEKLCSRKSIRIIPAGREMVERNAENTILAHAKELDVAFLVVGDPMGATTHSDIFMRAASMGIKVKIIHNASVLTAVGATGLQLYKFGRTASISFPKEGFSPTSHYDALKSNLACALHTLFLLDIDDENQRYMTVNDAVQNLLSTEGVRKENIFSEDTFCVGCARLGSESQIIFSGKALEILKYNFGDSPHCLIVPAELHFVEEDMLMLHNKLANRDAHSR